MIEQPLCVGYQEEGTLTLSFTEKTHMDENSIGGLVQTCIQLAQLKGLPTYRLSLLTDGSEKEVPDVSVFIDNATQVPDMPPLSSS